MSAVGVFERHPRVAVAISGGADSLALLLLVQRWARARHGSAIGLSVDHRLRPESGAEIRALGRWLAAREIAHRVLAWHHREGIPTTALQAKAREERYRLLTAWCRRQGILHLALAHHAGDQAETVMMRLVRGSGVEGLAGMSAILARDGVRLIRPLLLVDPSRLRATLRVVGQPWIEDPSNSNLNFERIRWRRFIPSEQRVPVARAAAEIGRERERRELRLGDLLAHARFLSAGHLSLPLQPFLMAEPEIALAALSRCLMAVSGRAYPPRRENLERLVSNMTAGAPPRTLGGCRVLRRADRLGVVRESVSRQGSISQCGRKKRGAETPVWTNPVPLAPGSFTVANLDVNIM
jgi:tRNA(Ile)-lysidine synthase